MEPQPHPDKGSQQAPNVPPSDDAHPSTKAGPPPLPEDFGDPETNKERWWQRDLPWNWWGVNIAMSLVIGWLLLRNVIGPMLSSTGP